MIDHAVKIYTIINDLLAARHHHEDCRCQMSDAAVVSTAIVAAAEFHGVIEHARVALQQSGIFPEMLSKSQLCRRLARLSELIASLFEELGMVFKAANLSQEYILDSMPVSISEMVRYRRSRLIPRSERKQFMSKHVAKGVYFYGFRLHLLITPKMIPVEFVLEPARHDDRKAFEHLPLALPAGSELLTDSNYAKRELEAQLLETESIRLNPTRTRSYKQRDEPSERDYKRLMRRRIETTFSRFTQLLPRNIHAVTLRGLYQKILYFVVALQFLNAFL